MNKKYNKCIICGSERILKKYLVNDFNITQCKDCSLVFVLEKLSQKEVTEYYEIEDNNDDYIYTDPENIENLNYYYVKLRSLIKKQIPTGKILDIGCSGGYFLNVMDGWERHGIELSSQYAEEAKAKYGKYIHIGTLENYDCPESYFDVITLQDVLDHMLDPIGVLKKCNSILKPDGLIIIKVHNISCLYAKLMGANFYAIIPPYHLTYFNKASLGVALTRSGFEILYNKYIAHILFLKTIPYRLSRGKKVGFFFGFYKVLNNSLIGNIKIKKNLRDIITVVAKKKSI